MISAHANYAGEDAAAAERGARAVISGVQFGVDVRWRTRCPTRLVIYVANPLPCSDGRQGQAAATTNEGASGGQDADQRGNSVRDDAGYG